MKSFMNMIDRVWKPFRQAMAGGSQESIIKVLEELGKDICRNDKDQIRKEKKEIERLRKVRKYCVVKITRWRLLK